MGFPLLLRRDAAYRPDRSPSSIVFTNRLAMAEILPNFSLWKSFLPMPIYFDLRNRPLRSLSLCNESSSQTTESPEQLEFFDLSRRTGGISLPPPSTEIDP